MAINGRFASSDVYAPDFIEIHAGEMAELQRDIVAIQAIGERRPVLQKRLEQNRESPSVQMIAAQASAYNYFIK